ncbi:hypothetical protein [Hyphococcus luteus]|uniref:Uncharacterized protein n=1 Tax=Hyphococcus luteus TaxID=2058213 RepID=A0A2S7K978_9PROT|nr:hypothetical protein [Marinicaulis flavus]PQA89031.1 hypothetical protein CW354_03525 [Marinicaulis flavus]
MCEFLAGIIGAVVGGAIAIAGQWLKHQWETQEMRNRDEKRKKLLKQMLDKPGPNGWRKMETLSGVIGANRDETARLLTEIDARSSETEGDVWVFIKDKPLP